MIKSVIKEIIIFLLLFVAIALILGILFYDYIPINKTVPSKVEPYNIPADIQNEINTTTEGSQNIIKTYSIDSKALSTYNKGKVNPFAPYNTDTTDNNTTSSDTNNRNTVTSDNNTTSEGTFYEIPPSAPSGTGK